MGLTSFVMVACGDEDEEHYLTVNGTNFAEHTFPGTFANGKSGIDYKQIFKIKSDVQWSLNGKVDWLNVSATSGKGEVDLTIYPSNENNTESERKATLLLSGDKVSISIDIIQGAGKPICYVTPVNEVALYDRICWEYEATANVNNFQWLLLSEYQYNRLTEKEKLEMIHNGEMLKHSDEYISFVAYDSHDEKIKENSIYYVVTLAYDGEGNAGELKSTKIETPAYKNADNDAWVSFSNIQANSIGFSFDTHKEGYCNTYHLIYGSLLSDCTYNAAIYAFEINYYLKYNKKHWFSENWELEIVTEYPNNHTFTYSSYLSYYPLCVAYGWGVFKSGQLSSDLMGFQWDTSEEEEGEYVVQRIVTNECSLKNIIIKRSEEQEKINKLRK